MAISVSQTNCYAFRTHQGVLIKCARLDVTGMTANSQNSVPHGLKDRNGNGAAPLTVGIEPTAANPPWEYQAADGTNLYLQTGASGATACSVYVEWGD